MGNLGHWYHLFPFIFIYFYLFFIISFSMKMISSVREKYDRCIIFYFLIMARRDTLHPHVLYRWVFVLCTQVPLGHNMMAKIEWYAIIMHSGTFASVYYWFYQGLLLFYLCIHFQYFFVGKSRHNCWIHMKVAFICTKDMLHTHYRLHIISKHR